jgi:hypothetical protein
MVIEDGIHRICCGCKTPSQVPHLKEIVQMNLPLYFWAKSILTMETDTCFTKHILILPAIP